MKGRESHAQPEEKKTSDPVARAAWVMPTGDQGGWGLRLGENGWGVA